jgi:hypothetical protein
MKIRRSIFWFTLICCIVVNVTAVWLRKKPTTTSSPTASPVLVQSDKIPTRQLGHSNQTNAAAVRAASKVAPPPSAKPKSDQMKEALSAFNDEDIVLFGRVIDQFDAPVANAIVAGSVQVNNGTRVGADKMSVTTDANGIFTFSGRKGKALGIYVTKEGYVMATASTRFVYSHLWSEAERYNPDPNNPAVIKMWKLQGAERLTVIDQHYKFSFSDAPINIDLMVGKIVPAGGDIKITMNRSPGEISERTLQDWSVRIEAVNGGLIQTSAEDARLAYELPASGYLLSYGYSMSTNTQSWRGALDQMFYLRSRNGQVFCKLNLGIAINQQPQDDVEVELHGELNPNASRNFEADANAMAMRQR